MMIKRVVMVCLLGLYGLTQAQTYPAYQDFYLNDYAAIVNADDAAQIRILLEQTQQETGLEVTVLTLRSYEEYTDSSFESFATGLFNEWGIGDAVRNDGALLLVSLNTRDVRIELGSGYSDADNRSAANVLDEYIVPAFQREAFSAGMLRASQELVTRLRAKQGTAQEPAASTSAPVTTTPVTTTPVTTTPVTPTPTTTPTPLERQAPPATNTGTPTQNSNQPWWLAGLAALLGGGGGGLALLRRRERYKPRYCTSCNHELERLDEVGDDVYLDDGQQTEEFLKSVDYDVWKCFNCDQHELHAYPAPFSRYKRCPSCDYRTLDVSRYTVQSPSCHAGGRDRISKDCRRRQCGFHSENTVSTPKRNCEDTNRRSSSSSSSSSRSRSSFSGGRSSGGGSSRKW